MTRRLQAIYEGKLRPLEPPRWRAPGSDRTVSDPQVMTAGRDLSSPLPP